jgi:hypothetical protein
VEAGNFRFSFSSRYERRRKTATQPLFMIGWLASSRYPDPIPNYFSAKNCLAPAG